MIFSTVAHPINFKLGGFINEDWGKFFGQIVLEQASKHGFFWRKRRNYTTRVYSFAHARVFRKAELNYDCKADCRTVRFEDIRSSENFWLVYDSESKPPCLYPVSINSGWYCILTSVSCHIERILQLYLTSKCRHSETSSDRAVWGKLKHIKNHIKALWASFLLLGLDRPGLFFIFCFYWDQGNLKPLFIFIQSLTSSVDPA